MGHVRLLGEPVTVGGREVECCAAITHRPLASVVTTARKVRAKLWLPGVCGLPRLVWPVAGMLPGHAGLLGYNTTRSPVSAAAWSVHHRPVSHRHSVKALGRIRLAGAVMPIALSPPVIHAKNCRTPGVSLVTCNCPGSHVSCCRWHAGAVAQRYHGMGPAQRQGRVIGSGQRTG